MKTVIGITGGIASGKSTVSAYLRDKGFCLIDADQVVRDLQTPDGRLNQAIFETFGADYFDKKRRLDRKKLGELVFSDIDKRTLLADIQDKIIREELLKQRDAALAGSRLVFMDIPLLFEEGYEHEVDKVWLVYAPLALQLKRLKERDNYTAEAAEKRLSAQLSIEIKRERADRVFDNSGGLETLYQQVDKALADLS